MLYENLLKKYNFFNGMQDIKKVETPSLKNMIIFPMGEKIPINIDGVFINTGLMILSLFTKTNLFYSFKEAGRNVPYFLLPSGDLQNKMNEIIKELGEPKNDLYVEMYIPLSFGQYQNIYQKGIPILSKIICLKFSDKDYKQLRFVEFNIKNMISSHPCIIRNSTPEKEDITLYRSSTSKKSETYEIYKEEENLNSLTAILMEDYWDRKNKILFDNYNKTDEKYLKNMNYFSNNAANMIAKEIVYKDYEDLVLTLLGRF